MIKEHFICYECGAEFYLSYTHTTLDDIGVLPNFCPWCAEALHEPDDQISDEEDSGDVDDDDEDEDLDEE